MRLVTACQDYLSAEGLSLDGDNDSRPITPLDIFRGIVKDRAYPRVVMDHVIASLSNTLTVGEIIDHVNNAPQSRDFKEIAMKIPFTLMQYHLGPSKTPDAGDITFTFADDSLTIPYKGGTPETFPTPALPEISEQRMSVLKKLTDLADPTANLEEVQYALDRGADATSKELQETLNVQFRFDARAPRLTDFPHSLWSDADLDAVYLAEDCLIFVDYDFTVGVSIPSSFTLAEASEVIHTIRCETPRSHMRREVARELLGDEFVQGASAVGVL